MKTIDWRRQLCQFLKISPDSTDEVLLGSLDVAAEKLEEADRLTAVESQQYEPPRYQIIYRVECAIDRQLYLYPEEPFVVSGGRQGPHLRGTTDPIYNFELYLERNKDISFITYKDYSCCVTPLPRQSDKSWEIEPSSLLVGESVSIVSTILCNAMKVLADNSMQGIAHPDFQKFRHEFASPYLWWFYKREEIAGAEELLDEYEQEQVLVFKKYLQDHSYATWSDVDSLIESGKISAQYIDYLFVSDVYPSTIQRERFLILVGTQNHPRVEFGA
jgi:hypothetical protein